MKALRIVRMPPPIIRGRLVRDSLLFWLGVRLGVPVLAIPPCDSTSCVVETFVHAPYYLPSTETSLAIVGIVVLMSVVQVRRLREVHLLRNLGVAGPTQLLLALAVAVPLEVAARMVAIRLPPIGPG
jgi:hypothetical protein